MVGSIDHAAPYVCVAVCFCSATIWNSFPSMDGGLSRTERQALSVLRERGPLSGGQLYVAVRRLEEQIFTGDGLLKRLVGGKG